MAFWDTVLNSANAPPRYGRRLVPSIIDDNARTQPNRACFAIPRCEALHEGLRDITWRTYANAINKMAYFIQREIGRSTSFETVMYLGFPDIRSFIVLVALIKTGHKALFSSYHNSLAAHTDLIQRTNCKILLHTRGFPVANILETNRMQSVCISELGSLLDDIPAELYPYSKSFEEAKHDPCFMVHTSGASGMPKPVLWTHWSLSTIDAHNLVPPLDGRASLWASFHVTRDRTYCAWPLYNGSGLGTGIMDTCFNNTTCVMGPSQFVTADVLSNMIDYANIDSAKCLPSMLEEIVKRPDLLAKLARLRGIAYVGGPLRKDVGETISQHTTLTTLMGSTEASAIVQHATDREDWAYICINPKLNGIQMRPIADLFELVFVKEPRLSEYQGVFKTYPHLEEYSMQDLYSPHPSKPYHWKHEGRNDDIIVFQNGWKFNPMVHERLIETHPLVRHAIVVGTGRDRPAVIVELLPEHQTEDRSRLGGLLEDIWPHIAQANNVVETYSQLERRYLVFASRSKPLPVEHGNIKRKAVVELYADEIDNLYTSVANAGMKGLFRTEG
ncbi:acetyl-CoA synthetase-like protein [Plenodomus tracheiphilus IPT5]|uniref:Acetyl-CoA synthetase-like protein n=1 Tax=Plenodomus tracheiphilus IPT5 TaxID=1408161 RepID=A0A6A7AQM2_9PLEO|nr:acetyl-CoA synthetase-like protein [Plenodomus tracheiphilus IPT5]